MWFDKLGLLVCVCVCVAVSGWVCRSIVSRFVYLVRSGVWELVPSCMYQSGWDVFREGTLGGLLLLLKGGLL